MTKCFRQFKNRKELIELVSSEVKASFEKTSSSAARPSWTAAPTSLWASSLAWEYQILCWRTSSTLLKNIQHQVLTWRTPNNSICPRANGAPETTTYIAKQNKSDVKHFKCHYRYGLTPLTRRLVAISETIFPASRASTRAAARALRALPSCCEKFVRDLSNQLPKSKN